MDTPSRTPPHPPPHLSVLMIKPPRILGVCDVASHGVEVWKLNSGRTTSGDAGPEGGKKKKQPQARFELATFRLLSECSTPKLLWRVTTSWNQVVRMAQWIRRLPTEQEILGSSPSTDCLFFFCWLFIALSHCVKNNNKKGVMRESNSRPPAPEAGIIPLAQSPYYETAGYPHPSPSKNRRQKVMRDVLELNQRPIGLQPIALPLS